MVGRADGRRGSGVLEVVTVRQLEEISKRLEETSRWREMMGVDDLEVMRLSSPTLRWSDMPMGSITQACISLVKVALTSIVCLTA